MKEAHRHCGMRGAFSYRFEFFFFFFCGRHKIAQLELSVSIKCVGLRSFRGPNSICFVQIAIFCRAHTHAQPYEWCAADTNGLCQFIFASNEWKSIDCIDTNNLRKPSAIADKWCASSQWSAVTHVLHTECIWCSRGNRIVDSTEWVQMNNHDQFTMSSLLFVRQ